MVENQRNSCHCSYTDNAIFQPSKMKFALDVLNLNAVRPLLLCFAKNINLRNKFIKIIKFHFIYLQDFSYVAHSQSEPFSIVHHVREQLLNRGKLVLLQIISYQGFTDGRTYRLHHEQGLSTEVRVDVSKTLAC